MSTNPVNKTKVHPPSHLHHVTSRTMSPSRVSRPCSPSPCRRPCQADSTATDDQGVKIPKWRGGGVSSRGSSLVTTRIPRGPKYPGIKGKENLRARGRGGIASRAAFGKARIVKPIVTVAVPKSNVTKQDIDDAQSVLMEISRDNSVNTASPRPKPIQKSPIVVTSKLVPDLHQKILDKIRINKRRSIQRSFQLNQSPCKAPPPNSLGREENDQEEDHDHDNSQEFDRESPVSGQDLQIYLSSVFNTVDSYRSGTVSARRLLDYISNLVDLPKLDKWKLDELNRLLDPDNDNRYVDMDTWSDVGKSWVDMMMNPDYHSLSNSDKSSEACDVEGERDHEVDQINVNEEGITNISFGSIEGFGGACDMIASAREIELEGKISELNYQLGKLRTEKKELEKNLVASEEFGINLTTELEDSHRRLSLSSSMVSKGDKVQDDGKLLREFEQQNCNLQRKVDLLEDELNSKEEKLGDMEVMVVNLRAEVCEVKDKEEAALALVEKFKEKAKSLEKVVSVKDEEIHREVIARELIEEKFEETKLKMNKLEQDISMKDEEIKNLTETTGASRHGSVGSSVGNNSFSTIHDISVDEKMLEENFSSCHQLQTPGKINLQPSALNKLRGPSASSTPNKGSLGSIAEEMMSFKTQDQDLPSPFCEKNDNKLKVVLDKLMETMRKAIGNQLDQGKKTLIMQLLSKEILNIQNVFHDIIEELPTNEDLVNLKDANKDLEEQLNTANTAIENLKFKVENNNYVDIEEDDDETADEEIENISVKVDAVVGLLHDANSKLLKTEETDFSLDPDTDVSGWQLDLEGIQLVEWQQRLVNISKKRSEGHGLRSAFPSELSRSPAPGASRVWQSLYKRLDDLHRASEISRDLLQFAGDSFREQSQLQLQVSQAGNQTKAITEVTNACCQTSSTSSRSTETQTEVISSPEEVSSPDHKECLRENCFCPQSQAKNLSRGQGSRWKSLFRGVFYLVFLLFTFTFFCGLEIDGDVYYPVTWYTLRVGLDNLLEIPDPVIAVSYQTGCRRP